MRNVQGYGLEMGIHSFMVSTLMNVCIDALCVRNVQGYGLGKGYTLIYGLYCDECVHR